MSIIESNENRAIARMVSRECSTGYQRAVEANIPVNRMSAILFELEMKGVVKALVGGVYHLLA